MQTAFAVYELQTEYKALWYYLCETSDLYKATERICKEYECPAVNNVDARYSAARKYMTFYSSESTATTDTEIKDIVKQIKELADKLSELV